LSFSVLYTSSNHFASSVFYFISLAMPTLIAHLSLTNRATHWKKMPSILAEFGERLTSLDMVQFIVKNARINFYIKRAWRKSRLQRQCRFPMIFMTLCYENQVRVFGKFGDQNLTGKLLELQCWRYYWW